MQKDYRKLLQCNVMHNRIEGALQERGVDSAEGPVAARGHARGKYDCVFFGDADIEIAFGMMRAEEIEAGSIGHRGGDGHDALILVGEFHQRVGKHLGVGGHAGRLGHAGLRIVRSESVKFLLSIERGLETAALLREHMQQHRAIFSLEKFKSFDQQRQVVSVDGAEVLQAKFFEHDRWPQHALGSFFGAAYNLDRGLAADLFHDATRGVVQAVVVLVGDDAMEVASDGADVAVDGPLVIVEDHDKAPGLIGDVVERFERNAIGERGVSGDGDHVLMAAG